MAAPIPKKKKEDPDRPKIIKDAGPCRYWESKIHRFLHSIIKHPSFEAFMGSAIVFNVIIMIVDTDLQTTCDDLSDDHCGEGWTSDCNTALLWLYFTELVLRLYVHRCRAINGWFALDALIVITGFVEFFVKETPNLQMLRLFRIMRLSRVVKMLRHFPTLYLLLRGFQGAMEAIAWGVMLILVLLLLWAIVAVELLHEDNAKLDHGDNEWCRDAFSSVSRTVLYFFQTLVAGDSWGACSIPIIQVNFWAVFIFGGALVTVQLGFTNLILAIIVDQAVMAREEDNEALIKAKQKQKMEFALHLKQVLEQADHDNSGTLSLDEMRDAYDQDSFVRNSMDMLDVDRHDLATLFHFMGGDEDGEVSYNKFVEVFSKCQTQDMRVYLMGMKLQIEQLYSLLHQHTRGSPPVLHQQSRDLFFSRRMSNATTTRETKGPEVALDGSWDDVAQESQPSQYKPSSEPFVPPSRWSDEEEANGGSPDLRNLDGKCGGMGEVRSSQLSDFETEMERLQKRLEIRLRDMAAEVVLSATEMANLARVDPSSGASTVKLDDFANCWAKWQQHVPPPQVASPSRRSSGNNNKSNSGGGESPNDQQHRSPSPKPPPLQPPQPLQWRLQAAPTATPGQGISRLTGSSSSTSPSPRDPTATSASNPQQQHSNNINNNNNSNYFSAFPTFTSAVPNPTTSSGSGPPRQQQRDSGTGNSRGPLEVSINAEKLEREPTVASAHTPPLDVI